MTDYSHIPVNIIVAKDKKNLKETVFECGDYVTAIPDSPYSVTTNDCIGVVTELGATAMRIKIIAHVDPEYKSSIGNYFVVDCKYFVKAQDY